MPLNKDGLEAGAVVDFATLQRIKRQHKGAQHAKPRQEETAAVRQSEQPEHEDSPKPVSKKAPKKGSRSRVKAETQ